jgi:hypothetical protein
MKEQHCQKCWWRGWRIEALICSDLISWDSIRDLILWLVDGSPAVESIVGSALSFIKEMRVQATWHRYVSVLKCVLMAMTKK